MGNRSADYVSLESIKYLKKIVKTELRSKVNILEFIIVLTDQLLRIYYLYDLPTRKEKNKTTPPPPQKKKKNKKKKTLSL